MTPITDKIKQLPDGKKLCYAVMTGITVEGYNGTGITADDLKSLVSELETAKRALEQMRQIAVDAVGLIATTANGEPPSAIKAGMVSIARHLNERLAEVE